MSALAQPNFTYSAECLAPGALRARWRARNKRKHTVPALTLPLKTPLHERIALALASEEPEWRPKTRGDCASVSRPCAFVACEHSLYASVTDAGGLTLHFPDLEPDEMPAEWSCSLDVADRGGATLEEIGAAINTTRERARQLEMLALKKLGRTHLRVFKET